MAHVQRRVEGQARIQAAHAVALAGELDVMPCGKALELRPAHPARGEWAGMAAGLQLGGRLRDFDPRLRRFLRVQTGGLEGVLVVVEYRRRAVEREAQHLPVRGGVIAGDGRHVGRLIELDAGIGHDLADRDDRALAGHHRRRADFEHLQDVRRVTGTIGRNRRRHRFVVAALERGDDLVFGLAGVELIRQIADPLAQRAGHRVPPLNLGLGMNRHRRNGKSRSNGKRRKSESHVIS